MLLNVYLFSFALGAVLVVASIFMGGDDADVGADGDVDLHVDADVDHGGGGHDHAAGGLGGFFGALSSLRFWTFFALAFGMMGALLEWRGLVGQAFVGLGLALAVGFIAGYGAVETFRRLAVGETGEVAGVKDYVGKSGRVLVAVPRGGVGKVRIQLRGTTVDLLATTEEAEPIAIDTQALVIEMQGTKALVTALGASDSEA